VFPSFVVITAWVTLLYVVGLAMGAERHKHWSDRTGEPRFANSVVKLLTNGGTRPLRHERWYPTAKGLSGHR
jgi:hypothetical protein